MTITSTTSAVTYTANGATTAFSVTYHFDANSELVVTTRDGNTITTKTITTHYTVTGAGTGGGTVTFLTAPQSGLEVRIERQTPITQTLSLASGGPFSPADVMGALDKLTRVAQDLSRGSGASNTGTYDSAPLTKNAAGTGWDAASLPLSSLADGVVATDAATYGQVQAMALAAGTGNVVGPASAADNAIARYDSTTGKLLQSSGVYVDDNGNVGSGTASPSQRFHAYGASAVVLLESTSSTGACSTNYKGDDRTFKVGVYSSATAVKGNQFFVQDTTAGADRFRVDTSGNLIPATDNAYSLGVTGARWSAVWSANGTIQTSDARQKTNVADCDLGLDWLLKLKPVSYTWTVGGNEPYEETDADGNTVTKFRPKPGKRRHYGLLAQQVRQTLDEVGVKDFGGWVLTDQADPNSEQGLRPDQFIAPLIRAIQELAQRPAGGGIDPSVVQNMVTVILALQDRVATLETTVGHIGSGVLEAAQIAGSGPTGAP